MCVCVCVCVFVAMLYKVGQKSTCSQEDFPNNEKWTRCKYLNGKWY